jgi:hypothetical protein
MKLYQTEFKDNFKVIHCHGIEINFYVNCWGLFEIQTISWAEDKV